MSATLTFNNETRDIVKLNPNVFFSQDWTGRREYEEDIYTITGPTENACSFRMKIKQRKEQ